MNNKEKTFLAFDIGAESGRGLVGRVTKKSIIFKEISRFSNDMILENGHLHWDIHYLFEEIKKGIVKCIQLTNIPLESMAVDTWGVDFGMIDKDGTLLGLPFAYREKRNQQAMNEFLEIIPQKHLYELTGIQLLQFNSLFQLYALKRFNPDIVEKASKLLFMPDLINFLLTGKTKTEFTIATTSQLYNPVKGEWEDELFDALDIPKSLMQDIVPPGTFLGNITESSLLNSEKYSFPVLTTASHDTGSAVAAVPAVEGDWVFISSGTWSIIGIETQSPIINERTHGLNFTNEGGINNTFRFSKNITGLWLIQELKKIWAKEKQYSYSDLTEMAGRANPFYCFIDPDHPSFLNPDDMEKAIVNYCIKTGQPLPQSKAGFIRSILEGLAFKYRSVLEELLSIISIPVNRIHIIGGGSKNELLCQFTANATGLEVFGGPSEATAIGNIMIQAIGTGTIDSVQEMRKIILCSSNIIKYYPQETGRWDRAYNRFCTIAL